jgi:hypothetical protein
MADDPRPTPPERPPDELCCGRGCTPCIFDFYEDALARYEARLKEWQDRHPEDRRLRRPP